MTRATRGSLAISALPWAAAPPERSRAVDMASNAAAPVRGLTLLLKRVKNALIRPTLPDDSRAGQAVGRGGAAASLAGFPANCPCPPLREGGGQVRDCPLVNDWSDAWA